MFIAFKAGDNAANHANLDVGTFVLDTAGERFAIDLGADDYALPGYFSAGRRFGYYRLATAGQNTLLIDETNQSPKARARTIAFDPDAAFARGVVDLSPAYPAARTVVRGFALMERRAVAVVDEIDAPAGRRIRWQMHSRAAVRANGDAAELRQGNAVLQARIIGPSGARFVIESATRPAPENPNTGVTRLCVDLTTGDAPIRIMVAFALGSPPTAAELAPARRPLAAWGS
jgi:Heparinase II/III-like protein